MFRKTLALCLMLLGFAAVAATLEEPAVRVGTLVRVEGLVLSKQVQEHFWSFVREGWVLKPGQWLKTSSLGGCAVEVRLDSGATLVLGPGSQIEVFEPDRVRLIAGVVVVTAGESPVHLMGEGGEAQVLGTTSILKMGEGGLQPLADEPAWYVGFRQGSSGSPLGALTVQVDGRDIPLRIGQHHVSVEIRDQIARTTVEEVFVNTADVEVEGMFEFPLPSDASVSSFGVWMGEQLVEADIVEKTRARQIFEVLKFERKDPGLLEWTAGNLFKTRLAGIPARGEKRIRLQYTQVLPMADGAYHYRYLLKSSAAESFPIDRFSMSVTLASSVDLQSVESPGYPGRVRVSGKSASLEVEAERFQPTRDFELDVVPRVQPHGLVLATAEQDGVGYFLLLASGGDVAAPADPRKSEHLVILADTSASIKGDRFELLLSAVDGLVRSLADGDTFSLAACDVECRWLSESGNPASEENAAKAVAFLRSQGNLGWTDVKGALLSGQARSGDATRLVWISDGMDTVAEREPGALLGRLSDVTWKRPVDCMALGSGSDLVTLEGISRLSGGRFVVVPDVAGLQEALSRLVRSWAGAGLSDVSVQLEGLTVQTQYPKSVPMVPALEQLVVVGTFDPGTLTGDVTVRVQGRRDGEESLMEHRFGKEERKDNSFIPRLWARRHLDFLLGQPVTAGLRDSIVEMSSRFGIATPYTSFLVLNSDAERKRFGVRRHFRRMNGEQFFAQGVESAEAELARQQMIRARSWRLQVRDGVLVRLGSLVTFGAGSGSLQAGLVPAAGAGFGNVVSDGRFTTKSAFLDGAESVPMDLGLKNKDGSYRGGGAGRGSEDNAGGDFEEGALGWDGKEEAAREAVSGETTLKLAEKEVSETRGSGGEGFWGARDSFDSLATQTPVPVAAPSSLEQGVLDASLLHAAVVEPYWLSSLFPWLGVPQEKKTQPGWEGEALELVSRMPVWTRLQQNQSRVSVEIRTLAPSSWNPEAPESITEGFWTPDGWACRYGTVDSEPIWSWFQEQLGTLSETTLLGRVGKGEKDSWRDFPCVPYGPGFQPLFETQSVVGVSVEREQGKLVLRMRLALSGQESIMEIDETRMVPVSWETRQGDLVLWRSEYRDYVEVQGVWWPGSVVSFAGDGQETGRSTVAVTSLSTDEVAKRWEALEKLRRSSILLDSPGPELLQAKRAVREGKGTINDHFSMLCHYGNLQSMVRALKELDALEALASGKEGLKWLRMVVLQTARRNEAIRQQMDRWIREMEPSPGNSYKAKRLIQMAQGILDATEFLTLLDLVRPIYEAAPEGSRLTRDWMDLKSSYLEQAGRGDEALELRRQMARDYPGDLQGHSQLLWNLLNYGEFGEAEDTVNRLLEVPSTYVWRSRSLLSFKVNLFKRQGRQEEILSLAQQWAKDDPEAVEAWMTVLSSMVFSGHKAQADELAKQWMNQLVTSTAQDVAVETRGQAAVSYALGAVDGMYSDRLHPMWLEPLETVAVAMVYHPRQFYLTVQILGNWTLQGLVEKSRMVQAVFKRAIKDSMSVPLVAAAQSCSSLSSMVAGDDERKLALALAANLLRRAQTLDPWELNILAPGLEQLLRAAGDRAGLLDLLRWKLSKSDPSLRGQLESQLITELTSEWSEKDAQEALDLIPGMAVEGTVQQQALSRGIMLRAWVWRAVSARLASLQTPAKLQSGTRDERAASREKQLQEALTHISGMLAAFRPKAGTQLEPWVDLSSIRLSLAGKHLEGAEPSLKAILLQTGSQIHDDGLVDQRQLGLDALDLLLYLAVQDGAAESLRVELVGFLEQQLESYPGDETLRQRLVTLLLATDDVERLQSLLAAWGANDQADPRFSILRGYLLAEVGELASAIEVFEKLNESGELGPGELSSLTDWYRAVGDEKRRQAIFGQQYEGMQEWELQQRLSQLWASGTGPQAGVRGRAVDEEILGMVRHLFATSQWPQNYIWQVVQILVDSHDFRLLSAMLEGLSGHTRNRIYPVIQSFLGAMYNIQDEASLRSALETIAKLRGKLDQGADPRALDLMELAIYSRILIQYEGPLDTDKPAANLLTEISQGPFGPGEARLASDFLMTLGRLLGKESSRAHLEAMAALHREVDPASSDALWAGNNHCQVLWWYEQKEEGLKVCKETLDGYIRSRSERLSTSCESLARMWVSLAISLAQETATEKRLLELQERQESSFGRDLVEQLLYQVYGAALASGNSTTHGSGEALYGWMLKSLEDVMVNGPQSRRSQLIYVLESAIRVGFQMGYKGVSQDLERLAAASFWDSPVFDYSISGMVNSFAYLLADLSGADSAMKFLILRMEGEPEWVGYTYYRGWQQYGYSLGNWRLQARLSPDWERRLLNLLLPILEDDLSRLQGGGSRPLMQRGQPGFWFEKVSEFEKVALKVGKANLKREDILMNVARFLAEDLGSTDKAITLLNQALRLRTLGVSSRAYLVELLHRMDRFKAAVPVASGLVKEEPRQSGYWSLLMTSQCRGGDKRGYGKTIALLKKELDGQWMGAQDLSNLGKTALDCSDFATAADWLERAVKEYRSQPGSLGWGMLPSLYSWLSEAYRGLGKSLLALDAGLEAAVAWGDSYEQRNAAILEVESGLMAAKDLPGLVASVEEEERKTGTVNALLHRCIGKVWLKRDNLPEGIVHLRLSLELQPYDVEARQLLAEALDGIGRPAEADEQFRLAALTGAGDALRLEQLAFRLEQRGEAAQAKRYRTSVIELIGEAGATWRYRAALEVARGNYPLAIDFWRKAIQAEPMNPMSYLGLAECLLHEGDLKEGLMVLKQIMTGTWPAEFGDVRKRALDLQQRRH